MGCRSGAGGDSTGLTPAPVASSISNYSGENLDFDTARPPSPQPLPLLPCPCSSSPCLSLGRRGAAVQNRCLGQCRTKGCCISKGRWGTWDRVSMVPQSPSHFGVPGFVHLWPRLPWRCASLAAAGALAGFDELCLLFSPPCLSCPRPQRSPSMKAEGDRQEQNVR